MNTIGKKGKLGEHIRCVVSVAMLTEGWDANTVTHILGVRPFRSQLLCEQVVGRGLRRRSYAVNPDTGASNPSTPRSTGCRSPSSRATGRSPAPPRPAIRYGPCPSGGSWRFGSRSSRLPSRATRRTTARRVRRRLRLHLDQAAVALWVENQGVIGAAARWTSTTSGTHGPSGSPSHRQDSRSAGGVLRRPCRRPAAVAVPAAGRHLSALARRMRHHRRRGYEGPPAPDPGLRPGSREGIRLDRSLPGEPKPVLMPIIRRFDPSVHR